MCCVCHPEPPRHWLLPDSDKFLWALILGGGLLILPKSPRYHVKKGHLEKAAQALSSVRGQPVESEHIRDELAEIIANYEYERSITPQTSYIGSWSACFKGDIRSGSSNIRRTVVGMAYNPIFSVEIIDRLTPVRRYSDANDATADWHQFHSLLRYVRRLRQ